jgi:hypothetical protein
MAENYVTKVENGVCRLYRQSGELERVICAGAMDAEVKGDEVVVKMQGGKKKIYSVRGFFKRSA